MKDIPSLLRELDELKARLDSLRPLDVHQAANLHEYFRVGLTYASNALEGNSLSLLETKVVIEDGLTVAGKPLRDHLEAQGHAEAYDELMRLAQGERRITEQSILTLHKLFYRRIDPPQAGQYRKVQVYFSGSEFRPPAAERVSSLMRSFCRKMASQRKKLHPVLFAAWLHLELVTIHPFIDGNGRTARLLMNLALVQDGYPVLIIPPILRADYLQSLEAAQMKQGTERYERLIIEAALTSVHDYWRLVGR